MTHSSNPQTLTPETILQTLREQSNLFERYQIKTLALFGSTARNEATTTSDLDFLVEFTSELTFRKYMNLKFFLEDLFNRKVDLVIKTDLKPQIRAKVIQESINVA